LGDNPLLLEVVCGGDGEAVGVVVALPRGPRPVLRLLFGGGCADDGNDVITVDDDTKAADRGRRGCCRSGGGGRPTAKRATLSVRRLVAAWNVVVVVAE
jgi:hypothetical protein